MKRHELPAQSMTITRSDLVRYAGASGDFNTIHWDDSFARSVGLPGVIAHGMLTMAEAARVVTDWAVDPGAVLELSVRFARPVVVPPSGSAVLEVSGTVVDIRDDGHAEIDLTAMVAGEPVLVNARAVVSLAARASADASLRPSNT